LLKLIVLALRLHSTVPALGWSEVFDHAVAAEQAATAHVQPELLLAIAFVESRFDATATSRVEGSTRRTGRYPSTAPPPNLAEKTSLYCGPLQTFAGSWRECMALRALPNAYAAGASELEQWLRDRRVRGDVVRALAGHGCGNHGVLTGRCNAYPERVLSMWRVFTIGVAHRPSPVQARVAPRT
jgi:hypothetical protein